jgi:hypothetical protein
MEVEAKRVVSLKVNQNRALGKDLLNESAMFLCHNNQKSKYDDVESMWKTDWIYKKSSTYENIIFFHFNLLTFCCCCDYTLETCFNECCVDMVVCRLC